MKLFIVIVLVAFVIYSFRQRPEGFSNTATGTPSMVLTDANVSTGGKCTLNALQTWYNGKVSQYETALESYKAGSDGEEVNANILETLRELQENGSWTNVGGEVVMSKITSDAGNDYNQLGSLLPSKRKCQGSSVGSPNSEGLLTNEIPQGRIYHVNNTTYMTNQGEIKDDAGNVTHPDNTVVSSSDAGFWDKWIGSPNNTHLDNQQYINPVPVTDSNGNVSTPLKGISIKKCMEICDNTEVTDATTGTTKKCKGFMYNAVDRSCIMQANIKTFECRVEAAGGGEAGMEASMVTSNTGTKHEMKTQPYSNYLIFERNGMCPTIQTKGDAAKMQGNTSLSGDQATASTGTTASTTAAGTNMERFANINDNLNVFREEDRIRNRENFRVRRRRPRNRPHYKTLNIPEPPKNNY